MKIYLNWQVKDTDDEEISKAVEEKVKELLAKHKRNGSLGVIFCDDQMMKILNTKYRGKNTTTDVLSFEFGSSNEIMGDVYISIPTAKKQAREYNVSLKDEALRLAIHGTLHVLGYNHKEMGVYGS